MSYTKARLWHAILLCTARQFRRKFHGDFLAARKNLGNGLPSFKAHPRGVVLQGGC